jgi:predicted amidohydrolase YtcJ
MKAGLLAGVLGGILISVSASQAIARPASGAADLILTDARVYTLRWGEPALDGKPAPDAPLTNGKWHPDATAVAIRGGMIVYVGSNKRALALRGKRTRVMDLNGATVLPGLVDSHTHFIELGAKLESVDLTGVATEAQAVALVAARAKSVPKGEWIFGAGWDEGAWANRYPDKQLLSAAVPDHPVVLRSLHGFAIWVNQAALDAGKITNASPVPVGGEMRLGADGQPNGLFLNRAATMVDAAVPPEPQAVVARHALKGLNQMAADGYVTVHEAGVPGSAMAALQQLEAQNRLPIRVYAMLSLRDPPLMRQWIAKGPDRDNDSMLVTRAVKAYYDGALGSRGARLLADYADKPGHRGISGDGYGFDQALARQAMQAGFQLGIHAIGDAGNREVLDFYEAQFKAAPGTAQGRHRIEHAQIISPPDQPRFAGLGVIASMEPPHAVEDKGWAEARLGPQRVLGAYAWRTLRRSGARLTFNADNPGSDHSIFYGLHSAITRQDKQLQPAGGWYPAERLTIEEAIRAYTSWSAYAAFREGQTGIIAKGRWADLTVMDIDPFALAATTPEKILAGKIRATIVNGKVLNRQDGNQLVNP